MFSQNSLQGECKENEIPPTDLKKKNQREQIVGFGESVQIFNEDGRQVSGGKSS